MFLYLIISISRNDLTFPFFILLVNTLKKLEERDYININGKMWSMTEKGFQFAGNLYNQNLENE